MVLHQRPHHLRIAWQIAKSVRRHAAARTAHFHAYSRRPDTHLATTPGVLDEPVARSFDQHVGPETADVEDRPAASGAGAARELRECTGTENQQRERIEVGATRRSVREELPGKL